MTTRLTELIESHLDFESFILMKIKVRTKEIETLGRIRTEIRPTLVQPWFFLLRRRLFGWRLLKGPILATRKRGISCPFGAPFSSPIKEDLTNKTTLSPSLRSFLYIGRSYHFLDKSMIKAWKRLRAIIRAACSQTNSSI
jgi:hypothetical protein